MADGYASQYLPAMSRLMGEVEQPTNAQSMLNPQFGGSPEQLMGILQHPQTQALMDKLGIHFDPSTLRQSPFLPNSLMQAHPMLGHMLTSAMANAASTPEAPLVSGAGSGISRAFQGMQGGPEMLRQFQVRQMLSPMQAMGSMIPGQEFQRKQQLLQLLQKMEEDRQAAAQRHEGFIEQSPAGKLQNEIYAPPGTGVYFTRGAPQQTQIQPPSGGMLGGGGLGPMQTGPTLPGGIVSHPIDVGQAGAFAQATQPQRFGSAELSRARAAEQSQETAGGMAPAKVADVQSRADLNKAKAPTEAARQEELKARAAREKSEAAMPGGRYGARDRERWAKDYNDVEARVTAEKEKIDLLVGAKTITPELGERQKAQWDNYLARAKENYDRQMGKSGQSATEAERANEDLPKTLSPGAKNNATRNQTGRGGQAGGSGSQRSEGTAINPLSQW